MGGDVSSMSDVVAAECLGRGNVPSHMGAYPTVPTAAGSDDTCLEWKNAVNRVESGDKGRRFQHLFAPPALKHDAYHGSPTALAVGNSHNLSSFSSLAVNRS